MSDEEMMTDKEMLELDDSVENDKELKEKVGEVKSLEDIDDSQLEDWTLKEYSKKELRFIFNILKEKVGEYDPSGLLSMGAPQNEYFPELFRMMDDVKRDMSLESFQEMTDKVFIECLEDYYDEQKLSAFSSDVYGVLKERKYVL